MDDPSLGWLTPVASIIAGPGGAMVLLAVVLGMVYRLMSTFVTNISIHMAGIDEKFERAVKAIESASAVQQDIIKEVKRVNGKLHRIEDRQSGVLAQLSSSPPKRNAQ